MAKNIKLVKSLIGRKKDQIATAQSLGLKKVGPIMSRQRAKSIKSHTLLRLQKRKQGGAH